MNHELKKGPLLDESGNLSEAGFAYSLVKEYDRSKIKAPKFKIKEWDYYYIGNNHHGVAFTIDDNSYMGLGSVSILNFDEQSFITKSSMKAFTNGKINLPPSSASGDTVWKDKNYDMTFNVDGDKRTIDVQVNDYDDGKSFRSHIELVETSTNSMVIATPFDKPKHFYYNQKINNLKAKGYYIFDGKKIEFNDSDTRAVLDWGRGVWTYKNTWYWSSLNTVIDGNNIGFNLGYGFGNTSAASENMLFVNDKAYKLNDVVFDIPVENNKYKYLEPWEIYSKSGDIKLSFKPILDRKDETDVLIIKSLQHQVFGIFNGIIKVEDKVIEIKDVVSFAERVTNWW